MVAGLQVSAVPLGTAAAFVTASVFINFLPSLNGSAISYSSVASGCSRFIAFSNLPSTGRFFLSRGVSIETGKDVIGFTLLYSVRGMCPCSLKSMAIVFYFNLFHPLRRHLLPSCALDFNPRCPTCNTSRPSRYTGPLFSKLALSGMFLTSLT